MLIKASEKTTASLILFGAPLTTLFLITDTVTDPVNAPKLFIAGAFGFALLFVFIGIDFRSKLQSHKSIMIAFACFFLASLNSVLQSDSPLVQNLYGTFGRNTGFVAYLVMGFIMIGALNLKDAQHFKKIIWALQISGLVNVLYCAWVLIFGDFLSWSNPYAKILGLFGNPDFISAFLGVFISTLVAYSFSTGQSWKYRLSALINGAIAFYEIHRSHAIQGTVITVAGIAMVGFYLVRSRSKSNLVTLGYVFLTVIFGVLAILGTLQKGPLSFVYKRSVSLRGTYWESAVKMGSENPFSGVGMDSFGDWYHRARPARALVDMPGINTTTNAAHNVVLDFFAYGGWPLLLSYLGILAIGAISIFKLTLRKKQYDGLFVALATAWTCYQLQSIISINQIGLAIWGWLLTGALVAYEFSSRLPVINAEPNNRLKGRNVKSRNSAVLSPQLLAGIGMVIGLIIACPPLSADMKWRDALDSKDGNKVMLALKSSYLSPSDSQRFAQATQLFANSNLLPQAHEIALKAVEFNPDSYDNWRNLYYLSNSTAEEKALAVNNLKRLDPLNPDVLAR